MSRTPFHLGIALDGAGWHPAAWRLDAARPAALFDAAGLSLDDKRDPVVGVEQGFGPRGGIAPRGGMPARAVEGDAEVERGVAHSAVLSSVRSSRRPPAKAGRVE